jgi:hypothetical protein
MSAHVKALHPSESGESLQVPEPGVPVLPPVPAVGLGVGVLVGVLVAPGGGRGG